MKLLFEYDKHRTDHDTKELINELRLHFDKAKKLFIRTGNREALELTANDIYKTYDYLRRKNDSIYRKIQIGNFSYSVTYNCTLEMGRNSDIRKVLHKQIVLINRILNND